MYNNIPAGYRLQEEVHQLPRLVLLHEEEVYSLRGLLDPTHALVRLQTQQQLLQVQQRLPVLRPLSQLDRGTPGGVRLGALTLGAHLVQHQELHGALLLENGPHDVSLQRQPDLQAPGVRLCPREPRVYQPTRLK